MITIKEKLNYVIACLLFFSSLANASDKQCVILLHGILRGHKDLSKLETFLKRQHYIVINQDYPSTKKSIEELAETIIPANIWACKQYQVKQIHFVTHSMGGIVLQSYLQHHDLPLEDRIVMLSPPNHGSPVANLLQKNWLYHIITGPAGQELTTCRNSTPNRLHLKKKYQIGIITGTYNFLPFTNIIFKEPNDGLVSVSSATTPIMTDFLALPVSHPFIMDNAMVQKQIIYFLDNGFFMHSLRKPSQHM